MIFLPLILFLIPFSYSNADEKTKDRILAHLAIHDVDSAVAEGALAYKNQLMDELTFDAYLRALAAKGSEKEMLALWNGYLKLNPGKQDSPELIEAMAWGVLNQGIHSGSLLIRIYATLGAYFSQDAKGVQVLLKSLEDQNAIVRSVAIQAASGMRDPVLKNKMLEIFANRKNWNTYLDSIGALGKMKIKEARPLLIAIVSDPKSTAEEKKAAIESLVALYETIDDQELASLSSNERAGLRLLACAALSYFQQQEQIPIILPLVNDHNAHVRCAALRALGIMRYDKLDLTALLEDKDPNVAITAAWLQMLNDPESGQASLERWIYSTDKNVRRSSAAALASAGKYGYPLTIEAFYKTKDDYVRLNLSIGMLKQRKFVDVAAKAAHESLIRLNEKWSFTEVNGFSMIVPEEGKKESMSPSYSSDEMVRLEVLNMLAIVGYSDANSALEKFLEHKTWGISGTASALLLTEGDESAIALVKGLMKHEDKKIRIQAALILAMWGRDESAIALLVEAYQTAERPLKEKILESLGAIGAKSTLPFLLERLSEPSQSLRIIAASAVLQTLYH